MIIVDKSKQETVPPFEKLKQNLECAKQNLECVEQSVHAIKKEIALPPSVIHEGDRKQKLSGDNIGAKLFAEKQTMESLASLIREAREEKTLWENELLKLGVSEQAQIGRLLASIARYNEKLWIYWEVYQDRILIVK
jgi:hypothetical protein